MAYCDRVNDHFQMTDPQRNTKAIPSPIGSVMVATLTSSALMPEGSTANRAQNTVSAGSAISISPPANQGFKT